MIAERVYHCAACGSGSLVLHKGPASADAWGRCLQPSIAVSKGKSERHVNHTPTRKPPFFRSFFVDFFFFFFPPMVAWTRETKGGRETLTLHANRFLNTIMEIEFAIPTPVGEL